MSTDTSSASSSASVASDGSRRPVRVLIEYAVPGERQAVQTALEGAGFEVSACGGPHEPWGGTCPVLHGARCGLADAADVVLCGLWVENPENRAVIRGVRVRDPSLPIVVDAPPKAAEVFASTLGGVRTVFLRSAADAVAAVKAAVEPPAD